MTHSDPHDLICACGTPPGVGAISIVRLSGRGALELTDRCFVAHSATQNVLHAKSHSLLFGRFVEPHTRESIDDTLVAVMRGPHTYTGEDIIEINTHGSPQIVRRILRVLCQYGARLAEPGEFTRRAFENGQIDLAQAEAVCDIVSAQTSRASEIALHQLNGQLSERIGATRERIIDLLAEVEAHLDFPEEDIPAEDQDRWLLTLHSIGIEVQRLIAGGERGQLLRNGARVVLVGKPNAGKSSLFNRMLAQDRAIVTPEPGTTRDTLEAMIEVQGLPLTIVDTAGMRSATNEVERLGIVRTEQEIKDASVVLMCLPVDEHWTQQDKVLWDLVRDRSPHVVLTKVDLSPVLTEDEVRSVIGDQEVHTTSAESGEGIDELLALISKELLHSDANDDEAEVDPLVTSERHMEALRHTLNALASARSLALPPELELAAADLRAALHHLDAILGLDLGDEVLDRIFSRFCIGK